MSEFKPGDIVDIAIKGACVTSTFGTSHKPVDGPTRDTGTVLVFKHPNDASPSRTHTVNMGAEGVTVERVTPAEWPPQVNDLWRDRDGGLWFVIADHHGNPVMNGTLGDRHGDEYVRTEHGPLTLVHREEAES